MSIIGKSRKYTNKNWTPCEWNIKWKQIKKLHAYYLEMHKINCKKILNWNRWWLVKWIF
jgi:hypothetical protein